MARYTGPVCRLCRRDGTKLFLKGAKCFTDKCPIEKRNFPPGQHGQSRKVKKVVGYGLQLREKQKAKRIYFTLETQFRAYYQKAANKTGVTGELLLQQLETRLDNVAYRLGFAMSRRQARQVVRHGHLQVNGRKVNIPSFQVKVGDEIAIREGSKALVMLEGQELRRRPESGPVARHQPRQSLRQGHRPAEARGRQPARKRAAHRRTLFEIKVPPGSRLVLKYGPKRIILNTLTHFTGVGRNARPTPSPPQLNPQPHHPPVRRMHRV
jgi:small subunit ribosomal protein S4